MHSLIVYFTFWVLEERKSNDFEKEDYLVTPKDYLFFGTYVFSQLLTLIDYSNSKYKQNKGSFLSQGKNLIDYPFSFNLDL